MTMPDFVNGSFELAGGAMLALNCWRLYRDKQFRGVSAFSMAFFTAWGFWNLFYYPHLEQWLSFAGGCVLVTFNALWLLLAFYYARRSYGVVARDTRRCEQGATTTHPITASSDERRLAEINAELARADGWGACLTPLIEERYAILARQRHGFTQEEIDLELSR